MALKCFLWTIFLYCTVASGKRSFVVVIDTTASMRDEVAMLRTHIDPVLKSIQSSRFENFILVPFTDPDIGTPKISTTPEGLVNSLNDLLVRGGDDCLESSLTALEKALELGDENSMVFLFTDAPAKDIDKLPFVQTLCRQRKSQVVIFLSGSCNGDSEINVRNVYTEIAKACSGTVFHLDVQNLPQVFEYMKEVVKVEWTNIHAHNEFLGTKQFNFNVDRYTKNVIVTVAGDNPEVQVTNAGEEKFILERIIDTKYALVIRLVQPPIGVYAVNVCSRGQSLATFYQWKTLEFNYGFSLKIPQSLQETSRAPIPDATSYLIIESLDLDTDLYLLELREDGEKKTLQLEVLNESKRLYMAQAYFNSETPFRISIHGREKNTYEVIKGTTTVLHPQAKIDPRPIAATVESIKPESTLVEFMSKVNLFCKVLGHPKPEIWWEDENTNTIDSEEALLEWPSTYISYATIDNATTNSTIQCKGQNSNGESSLSVEVYIHREFTFEVLQYPKDGTIEYGTEGKLYCEATAYPEPSIKWYHNDSLIDENSENLEIVPEDNMLLIKNMSLEYTGEYKCEVSNDEESRTFTAVIDISGLEAPVIEVTESEYILKPGDAMEIECVVIKGNPTPRVTWSKLVDDIDNEVVDDANVKDTVLKILSATVEHRGVYKCEATNIQGKDSKEVIVRIQYPPKIKHADEKKLVKVGEFLELECNVKAEPKALVHWEIYQGDVIIAFGKNHNTDENHTHRFIVQPNDDGVYHCIAENEMGRAERKVTVNVVEPVYVEPLNFKSLTLRPGASVTIPCNVVVGRPVPTIRWEFGSLKSSKTILSRKTTTNLELRLRNITKTNEGSYQCVAENDDSLDSIKFNLIIE